MALGPLGGIEGFMLDTTLASGPNYVPRIISPQQAQLMFFSAGNNNAAPRFLHFYDTNIITNSSTGMQAAYVFEIPGNSNGAGSNLSISPGPPMLSGLQFNSGMVAAITANSALADMSGISGVNECFAVIGFR